MGMEKYVRWNLISTQNHMINQYTHVRLHTFACITRFSNTQLSENSTPKISNRTMSQRIQVSFLYILVVIFAFFHHHRGVVRAHGGKGRHVSGVPHTINANGTRCGMKTKSQTWMRNGKLFIIRFVWLRIGITVLTAFHSTMPIITFLSFLLLFTENYDITDFFCKKKIRSQRYTWT